MSGEVVIRVQGLRTQFGSQVIHDGLHIEVPKGEVLGVVGGSGTGKSVLLRTIIGLIAPRRGSVEVLGLDWKSAGSLARRKLQSRYGVLFQDGALFSSLTVLENIQVPMREHLDISKFFLDEKPKFL